ncbi:MAG: ABC transporter substrate-binding protein [Desertimonas sp.]
MTIRRRLMTATIAIGLLAGAANTTTSAATEDTADAATSAEMSDATLTVGISSDIGGLDPQSVPGTGGGNLPAYGPLFGGDGLGLLVIVDPDTAEWRPGVAESWEIAEDGLTWTFTLRDGVLFHNGEQLTSEDVKFSVDRIIGQAEYNPDFASGMRAQFEPIVESVEVVDPLTVVFHLQKPDPILAIRPLYFVPKAYVEDVGDDGFAQEPIGIGPFRFVSWDPGNELVLERFDDFYLGWDDPSGFHTPYVKTLIQRVIPDDAARLAALQAGEIDLAHNMSADIARQMDGQSDYQVFLMPGTQPMYISINTNDEEAPDGSPNPWRDARVREAANLAVDLDTIIATILSGEEGPTFGSASTGFGFPEGIEDQAWGYDPDRARELMAEAGYPDGFSTTMFGPTGRWANSRPVMEAVAEYLGQIGIEIQIQESQYQEWVTRMQQRDLPGLTFMGCTGGSDPGNNFRYCYVSEGAFQNGDAVDTAGERDIQDQINELVVASENETDRAARGELLGEIIELWYTNPRHIWLYEPRIPVIGSDRIAWTFKSQDLNLPEYWNIEVLD